MAALSAADLANANQLRANQISANQLGEHWISEHRISDYAIAAECLGVWRRRMQQIALNPADAPWVTRLIVESASGTVVGRSGFHGPPDAEGMVEVGYAVDPDFRRRGFARAALLIMLGQAAAHPDVRTVRATISPGNTASRNLVERYGFRANGEQWDDEDGLEIIFERASR